MRHFSEDVVSLQVIASDARPLERIPKVKAPMNGLLSLFLRRRNPTLQKTQGRWPLDLRLIRFSERDEDTRTLGDAVCGTLVAGETGSGKSSGPGNLLARKFLENGFGGMVLCFKSEESDTWVKRLKEAGREADTCVFGISAPWRFNFLDYESGIESGGLDHTDNLVNLLMDIVAVRRTAPLGNEASFWLHQKRLLIRNCLSLLLLAGEPLTLKAMNDLIQSAPNTIEEGKSSDWQSRSYLYAMLERA